MNGGTTDGKKWVAAPRSVNVQVLTGDVSGVWVADNETVRWRYSQDGQRVVGYSIKKKLLFCLGGVLNE